MQASPAQETTNRPSKGLQVWALIHRNPLSKERGGNSLLRTQQLRLQVLEENFNQSESQGHQQEDPLGLLVILHLRG